MKNRIKGGKADNLSIEDIAKKHGVSVDIIKKQLVMGIKVEKEHTHNDKIAKEIAMDHLTEFPDYYTRLNKMEKTAEKQLEAKESMGADASGSYEAPLSGTILKKDIHKLYNWKSKQKDVKEQMDASVSAGAMYDGPIGTAGPSSPMDKSKKKRKDPLKIDNAESIQGASITGPSTNDMIATKKGFPSWGGRIGEGGKSGPKIVTINDKCKTFPYCDQGASSDNAFKGRPLPLQLREAIKEASEKYRIPKSEIVKIIAEALPVGIDFTPMLRWGKGNTERYIYELTTIDPVTNEPVPLIYKTEDESKFNKMKLLLYDNDIKFKYDMRPLEDDDLKRNTPDVGNYDDDDDDTEWPEDDD